MNELIKVDMTGEQIKVSARELHRFLEAGADYRHWFPRMCEYGFVEGTDFNVVKIDRVQNEGNRQVKRVIEDAIMSLDMAKEVCMITRNEKGKAARKYFIKVEKDWNSPMMVLGRANNILQGMVNELTETKQMLIENVRQLTEQIEANADKVEFAEAIIVNEKCYTFKQASIYIKQSGYDTGEYRLFQEMREDGFLGSVGKDYNEPLQRWLDMNLFKVKTGTFENKYGKTIVTRQTVFTGKGLKYIIDYLQVKHGLKEPKKHSYAASKVLPNPKPMQYSFLENEVF